MNNKRSIVPCCVKKYWYTLGVAIVSFYLGSWTTISLMSIDTSSSGVQIHSTNTKFANYLYNHVEYAVFVLSAPRHQLQRDAIRSTWGKLVNNAVVINEKKVFTWNPIQTPTSTSTLFIKLYFVIGSKNLHNDILNLIVLENIKTEDIVLLNSVEDKYENLSYKVLTGIKFFHETLRNLKYLIKCDDDSFIRIDMLVRELEMYAPYMNASETTKYVTFKTNESEYNGFYWGYFNGKARIFSQGKWKEKDWFLSDKYLPYALGGGYVISRSIVNYIAKNYDILSCYNSEDVTMGVWTAALKKINRVHDVRFDTEWTTRGCNNNMLVRQKQQPKHMLEMYESLVTSQGKKICATEYTNRNSYFYNWNTIPSNCCSKVNV